MKQQKEMILRQVQNNAQFGMNLLVGLHYQIIANLVLSLTTQME